MQSHWHRSSCNARRLERGRMREELSHTEDGRKILQKDKDRVDSQWAQAIEQDIEQDPKLKAEVRRYKE